MTYFSGEARLSPNIAPSGIADQSSDAPPQFAQYANDGDFGTDIHGQGDLCAHTAMLAGSWWRLDLLTTYEVSAVAITGRKSSGNFFIHLLSFVFCSNELLTSGNKHRRQWIGTVFLFLQDRYIHRRRNKNA